MPPSPGVLLGTEELDKRKEAREALRAETMEFEKNWEANRVQGVETGKEEMGMQASVCPCGDAGCDLDRNFWAEGALLI